MFKKNGILKTIAILLVVFTIVSVASYSIARLNRGDSQGSEEIAQTTTQNLGTNLTGVKYLSSIDLILENAKKGETFNIVEVLPYGVNANTDLKTYATSGAFAKYVLYAYKDTYEGTFTEAQYKAMVKYQSVNVNPSTMVDDSHVSGKTIREVLDSADLIYVSSPTYTSYAGSNNMSEDVYNYLHTYVATNKPIIMDFVTASSTSSTQKSKTYYDFVNAVSRNHIRFRTYSWANGLAADKFFKANGSYYLKYSVNELSERAPGTVLVVTGSDTPAADSMYTRMSGYKDIIKEAYFGKSALKPENMTYTVWNANKNALTVEELNKEYDYILIENDAKTINMTDAVYNKLKALSESSKYILYDSRLVATTSGEISGTANNYLKLLQLYVSDKGVEQRKNVLAITPGYFASLVEQEEAGIPGAEPIAELLNGSEYRDSSTTGVGGRKYRVLEIQPCYPVDLELASQLDSTGNYPAESGISGGYYTYPDQVLYGVTKEEIEEGTEYYAFEFSKAKIAYATGVPYEQIEVDAMSTNELISSKEVVLENYDLVYIGGNASALIPHMSVNYAGTDFNWQSDYMTNALKGLTAFDMYTHTGAFVDYDTSLSYGRIGTETNSVQFNGNDLTVTKLTQLKNYVDSGLPIIIDKLVTDAFVESYTCTNRLKQLALHNIDPDSNMYKFLKYTYEEKRTAGNVGWGTVDAANDETTVNNTDRVYGNTLGSTVTVYNTTCSAAIKGVIDGSETRPALSLSAYPKQYVEGNASTTNTSPKATFTAGVNINATNATSGSYNVALLVDSNGDGIYSEEEEVDSATCSSGGTVDLEYQLNEDFFGLVNWKVKATAPNGVLCDVKTGNSFFKVTSDMKKQVRILQLMPVDEPAADKGYIGDRHSLYFCTECQQATKLIENNITLGSNAVLRQNLDSFNNVATVWDGAVNVGKHEHDFGIVKFDTTIGGGDADDQTKGNDDWETNFADELTHGPSGTMEDGDYEFDLDILTVEEFKDLCSAATERTDDQIDTAATLAEDFLVQYQEEYAALTSDANLLKVTLETELYKAAGYIEMSGNTSAYLDVIVKGIGTSENPGQWMIDGDYYKMWQYFNGAANSPKSVVQNFDALATAYNNYIAKYDEVIALKEQYKMNMRQAGNDETWLTNNYDIVILGLADEFAGKDLDVVSCTQIKTYLEKGGSVLNTHDTITAKPGGAPIMSDQLRQTFGMDRFHVVEFGESTSVSVRTPTVVEQSFVLGGPDYTSSSYTEGLRTFTITNKDITITVPAGDKIDFTNATVTDGAVHTSLDDQVKVTIIFEGANRQNGNFRYYHTSRDPNNGGSYENAQINNYQAELKFDQAMGFASGSFNIGEKNVDVTLDISTGRVTSAPASTEVAEDGKLQVVVNVVDGENPVADGRAVALSFRGADLQGTTTGGRVTFIIDPQQESNMSIYDVPTDCKYRRYPTADSTKYFWTERLQAATEADYPLVITNAKISDYVEYNAPIGITDLYASCHSTSKPISPFRYAATDLESFDHKGDVDGWTYEAKYGTRKAEKVNEGGVTMYPFAISDELLISPTHSQTFSLDLEDENVAVWYTLGATTVDSSLGIDEGFARYVSSYFAASPRDGMNNYFLYSKVCKKGSVFYTGAGHQLITGRNKDNNDERRLFINVIVNCVTRGVTGPKLKLYNKCDETGNTHENCDDFFVDPKNKNANDKLAEEMNTLFYNDSIGMYQYNIDEAQAEIYPEFDFKAIAGTADIKEVEVFYDLNYGDGDGMNKSDTYVADNNHVLITSYDKDDQVDGKRKRLREMTFPDTLKLEDEYFSKNKNWTYIVIRVRDEKGKWKSARVKINIIPHLFDLTDATTDSQNVWTNTSVVDVFDKNNYRI